MFYFKFQRYTYLCEIHYNVAIKYGHLTLFIKTSHSIGISLVIYQKYIGMLYHSGDVIYDMKKIKLSL